MMMMMKLYLSLAVCCSEIGPLQTKRTSRRVDGSEQVASRNTMKCSAQQILTEAVIIQQV